MIEMLRMLDVNGLARIFDGDKYIFQMIEWKQPQASARST